MLLSVPTKNGTGISLYGDYATLHLLYDVIYHFAGSLNESKPPQSGQHQLLMNFAYEVRKGFERQRLIKEFAFEYELKYTLFGFQLVWTDLLVFTNVLRNTAGYMQSGKREQAMLYLLEYHIEKALYEYDAEGSNQIKNFIGQGIPVVEPNAFFLYQALHIYFVTDPTKGKARFRGIPEMIDYHFSPWREGYKELIAGLKQKAKEQNCEMNEIQFSEFPEIVW